MLWVAVLIQIPRCCELSTRTGKSEGEKVLQLSFENSNEMSLWSLRLFLTGAVVKEGDKVLIGQSKSDASNLLFKLPKPQRSSYETWFQVTSLPHHGTIMVGERNITKSKPNFSQYVINKLGITYLHDDSESRADSFTFAVWPNQKSKSTTKPEADFLEEMFNITITPINDKAQELRTKGLRLKVLQGNRLVLGPENLKVEDPDSPPEEIRYMIIRKPNNGFLAMAHRPHIPVEHFTQTHIDNSQVRFIRGGSPFSGVLPQCDRWPTLPTLQALPPGCHPHLHHPREPHWPTSPTRPDNRSHHQCSPVSSDQWEEPPNHVQDNTAPPTWVSARRKPGGHQLWTGGSEFRKALLPHDTPHCLRGPATVLAVYIRTNTTQQGAAFPAGYVRSDNCQQSGPSAEKKGPWCYWAC